MAPNARNAKMSLATRAAEKAVPCQNGFVTRTLLEGTACVAPPEAPPPAPLRALAGGLLEEFSHPRPLEASPRRPPRPRQPALGYPAPDPDLAGLHLGLRRLAGGALRGRPR